MNNIYEPGQAKVLFDYWPSEVEWFIVGGPADANEAQTINQRFPDVKCIAFEPNERMRERQRELNFPGEVYPFALWNADDEVIQYSVADSLPRSGTVCRDTDLTNWVKTDVRARTLDSLSKEFGPFRNCVLWLDIEHAELAALEGAENLFESGYVLMVNVEIQFPHLLGPIQELLLGYGMKEVKRWTDYIYVSKALA